MIERSALLKDLQGELPKIEKDILAYSESREDLTAHLKAEYNKAREAGRTAEHFVAWREAQITQAAVAWVLSCVFVRFLEDNGLLTEPMLAGPVESEQGEKRLDHAKQRMVAYYNENPTHEDREYLFSLFEQLEKYPVIAELLDHKHNPLWQIPVSADGAKRLIDFFQKIDAASGEIVHDFTDSDWDTRFLGDLYQDLSEAVRKRYALLQTPEFVESFILDYTLDKAKETFGLPGLRLIDPTCGSGHFLLTTFERVFEDWLKREPATNTRELAQRALDVVHGVDINPYAIAICRFRLLIAAMKAAGTHKVKDAPNFHFNLACGDSLLHGKRFEWQGQGQQTDLIDEDPVKHVLEVEDKEKLLKILGQQYHAVVGNPPYIVVKDKALNQAYREKYLACHGKYSLSVPFMERFYDLCISDNAGKQGYVGQITANSFIKRGFGKKLIESFLSNKTITHIVDTSGAYIPGHGTPTLILLGRNGRLTNQVVRTVLGKKGEPGVPKRAEEGKVWNSIVKNIETVPYENPHVSVVDQDKSVFDKHPWSLSGGGAVELLSKINEVSSCVLGDISSSIGFASFPGADEVFVGDEQSLLLRGAPEKYVKEMVSGDSVRDWGVVCRSSAIVPYDNKYQLIDFFDLNHFVGVLWPYQPVLKQLNSEFNWWKWYSWSDKKYKDKLSITYAEVSTHNHFSLEKGCRVFKQTAPVIKLKESNDKSFHMALLGILNSSLACFWIKQNFHCKGSTVDSKGARQTTDEFENFYQIAGTGLKKFPVEFGDNNLLTVISERINRLAENLTQFDPKEIIGAADENIRCRLEQAKLQENLIISEMIFLQEEMDWLVYRIYRLIDEDLSSALFDLGVKLGERAFEISLARSIALGHVESTWFKRHGSIPVVDLPSEWPDSYKSIIDKRLAVISDNLSIKLLEQPEFKRRWARGSWEKRLKAATTESLLLKLEKSFVDGRMKTCAQLADLFRRDNGFIRIAEIHTGTDSYDLQVLVTDLVAANHVPQMASSRLKLAAMPKYRAWQETWDKQRQEDAIDAEFGVEHPLSEAEAEDAERAATYELAKQQAKRKKAEFVGDIPLPPKYAKSDFQSGAYWPLRGKLDVPKERFFSLPGCEKEGDATLVIGWAGMNHLQRAQAIASWYLDRKEREGWEADKLTPMLVAIDELIPWLKQWHNDIDLEFGERMGDYYEGFLLEELRQLNMSRDELLVWAPNVTQKEKPAAKKKKATAE